MQNKRFYFASWAVTAITCARIVSHVPDETYKYLMLAVIGGYLGFQSWTDTQKIKGDGSWTDTQKIKGDGSWTDTQKIKGDINETDSPKH